MAGGEILRAVYAMNDGRWVFHQQGEPLDVEQVELYKKRRIRDRVTYGYVCDVAGRLGYDIRSPEFWKTKRDAFYYNERKPKRA